MWLYVVLLAAASVHAGDVYGPRAAANEVNDFPVTTVVNHVSAPAGSYVCPGGFVRSGNSCYYLSPTMATWQDAHYECRDRRSELARMEKRWEDKSMRLYLNRPELAPLERWIGGIYNWESKQWLWGATGKPLVYQGFSRRKPNADNKWRCIVLDPSMMYRWGARSCVERKHYICEKRLKSVPAATHDGPEALRRRNDKQKRQQNRRKKLERQRLREAQRKAMREAQRKAIRVH